MGMGRAKERAGEGATGIGQEVHAGRMSVDGIVNIISQLHGSVRPVHVTTVWKS